MVESDDPDTETDAESPDIRAIHECKITKSSTERCLRLPCQDPALISTEEFTRALLPQKYKRYMTSSILLPRTWSKDLEPKYRTITNRDQYFPYNKEVYDLATHTDPQRKCTCHHMITDHISQTRIIDWPCGCLDPTAHEAKVEQIEQNARILTTKWPPAPTHVLLLTRKPPALFHVPTRPKPATRRKRKGCKRLSLTDKKHYRVGDNSARKGCE